MSQTAGIFCLSCSYHCCSAPTRIHGRVFTTQKSFFNGGVLFDLSKQSESWSREVVWPVFGPRSTWPEHMDGPRRRLAPHGKSLEAPQGFALNTHPSGCSRHGHKDKDTTIILLVTSNHFCRLDAKLFRRDFCSASAINYMLTTGSERQCQTQPYLALFHQRAWLSALCTSGRPFVLHHKGISWGRVRREKATVCDTASMRRFCVCTRQTSCPCSDLSECLRNAHFFVLEYVMSSFSVLAQTGWRNMLQCVLQNQKKTKSFWLSFFSSCHDKYDLCHCIYLLCIVIFTQYLFLRSVHSVSCHTQIETGFEIMKDLFLFPGQLLLASTHPTTAQVKGLNFDFWVKVTPAIVRRMLNAHILTLFLYSAPDNESLMPLDQESRHNMLANAKPLDI